MLTVILLVAFLVAWIALYVLVIRPKLQEYRATAGIYAQLEAWEAGFWPKLLLLLKGMKVAIIGFITSSAPVLVVFYEKISGLDWSQFLSSEQAKTIGIVIAALGVIGPAIMVWLHQGAIADAAATPPQE